MPAPKRLSEEKLFVYCWSSATEKDFEWMTGFSFLGECFIVALSAGTIGSTMTLSIGMCGNGGGGGRVGGGGGGGGIRYKSSEVTSSSSRLGIVPILNTFLSWSLRGFGIAPVLLVSFWWSSFGLTTDSFGTGKQIFSKLLWEINKNLLGNHVSYTKQREKEKGKW